MESRDVPLHHKAALKSGPSEVLGRNMSEDAPPAYYDYDSIDEENDGSAPVTPSDVIYPNPDQMPRKHAEPSSSSVEERSGGEVQEIKSSNFVLRGISTNIQNEHNGGVGGGRDAGTDMVENNRVVIMPNEAVDLTGMNEDSDHNLIDSIMYIYYYGSKSGGPALDKEIGGSIIIIGAVVALAAQLLTIIILFLKHRRNRHKNLLFPVLTALLVMTFLANFFFIVGVQSSRNVLKCEIIAILLHYLHLSTTFWVFLYIYCVHEFIRNNSGPNMNFLLSLGVGMPAIYIVFNYMVSTSNYEVVNYCWMSVKKGMIVNYMVPIAFFIVATAVYGTLCLRLLRIKQRQQFTDSIESFIEHSRSEQMLNQIRQIGPECPQQAPTCPPGCAPSALGGSHRKLARCHSNPSSTTQKKSMAHLRSANLTTSSINLSSTPTMSPTKEQPEMMAPPPCCAGLLNQSHQMVHPPPIHCLDMMGTSKSICGDSKYSLGSISLANLSIQSLSSETEDFEDYKCGVKFAILFQIMFSICWFLAVIALEYPTSMMPIIYVIVLNLVNWILLAKCQAICPLMIVSPLSATAAESHTNHSFSKKSVKSIKSNGGNFHQNHNHHRGPPTSPERPVMVIVSNGVRSLTSKANGGCVADEPLKIPFDDPVGSGECVKKKKPQDSVSSGMDTIPLLAKSAGLRADLMTANTMENLDGEPPMTPNGLGDHSPTSKCNLDMNTHRLEFISTIST